MSQAPATSSPTHSPVLLSLQQCSQGHLRLAVEPNHLRLQELPLHHRRRRVPLHLLSSITSSSQHSALSHLRLSLQVNHLRLQEFAPAPQLTSPQSPRPREAAQTPSALPPSTPSRQNSSTSAVPLSLVTAPQVFFAPWCLPLSGARSSPPFIRCHTQGSAPAAASSPPAGSGQGW